MPLPAERRLYRKIFETLDRERLWQTLDHYGIEVSDRRSRDSLISGILQAGEKVQLSEVLSWLGRPELQSVCSMLGLEVGGREKEGYRGAILDHVREKVAALEEPERSTPDPRPIVRTNSRAPRNNRVFVVHGHDDTMRLEIGQFIERLRLSPIVLIDEPNKGQTVLEKIEKHRDESTYAVVLLSPDDVGYSKVQGEQAARSRARQNVILELGMMLGVLGRDRVAILHRGDLELPSDIGGLIRISYSPEHPDSAKVKLARELKTAGFDVDLNLAL
ncbi:MAG TPA: TIR domain-containing protein [Myxococcaceae bacterium]|jgi:predicted nucleotide-binding protein